MCAHVSLARAHPKVDEAGTKLESAEFESAGRLLAEAEAASDLGREDALQLLQLRALLHLALKAFYPARPPFALLHVDTTWKFREMIAFRDRRMKELGLPLVVHINREGLACGIGPLSHGAAVHTDIMKTEALKAALDKYGCDAAIGGARLAPDVQDELHR